MVQGRESKEGEKGFIAAGPSFCLSMMKRTMMYFSLLDMSSMHITLLSIWWKCMLLQKTMVILDGYWSAVSSDKFGDQTAIRICKGAKRHDNVRRFGYWEDQCPHRQILIHGKISTQTHSLVIRHRNCIRKRWNTDTPWIDNIGFSFYRRQKSERGIQSKSPWWYQQIYCQPDFDRHKRKVKETQNHLFTRSWTIMSLTAADYVTTEDKTWSSVCLHVVRSVPNTYW